MNNTFIAFSTITGNALAAASSVKKARVEAVKDQALQDDDFIEVIDASQSKIPVMVLIGRFLYQCRHLPSVWRGAGYIRA